MHTTILSIALLAAMTAACTRAPAQAAKAPPPPEPTPSVLTFAVGGPAGGTAPVIEGKSALGRGPLKFETHAPDTPANAHIELYGLVRADGTFDIETKYTERTREHKTIKWNPVVHVARGSSAAAKIVTGDGFARELRLRVD